MKHPFAVGAVVGVAGLLVWWKRHTIVALVKRARHPLSGFGATITLPAGSAPEVAVRQLRRYTFASMQDRSPIAGLTHASYALNALEFLEESLGRDAIKAAGYDPVQVRAIITKLQDAHAESLKACDPYITQVLDMEKRAGTIPGFALTGAAPAGA